MIGDDGVDYVTTSEAMERLGADVTRDMIHNWVKRRLVLPAGRHPGGESLFRWDDVQDAEYRTRIQRRGRRRRPDPEYGDLHEIDRADIMTARPGVVDAAQKPRRRCTIEHRSGYPCNRDVPAGSPITACLDHLSEAQRYMDEQANRVRSGEAHRMARSVPTPEKPTFVYYFKFGDRIKIGFSKDLKNRVTGVPCEEVLAVEPGSRDLEQMRHKQFDADRIYRNREWFRPSDALLSHIQMLVEHFGPPDPHIKGAPKPERSA